MMMNQQIQFQNQQNEARRKLFKIDQESLDLEKMTQFIEYKCAKINQLIWECKSIEQYLVSFEELQKLQTIKQKLAEMLTHLTNPMSKDQLEIAEILQNASVIKELLLNQKKSIRIITRINTEKKVKKRRFSIFAPLIILASVILGVFYYQENPDLGLMTPFAGIFVVIMWMIGIANHGKGMIVAQEQYLKQTNAERHTINQHLRDIETLRNYCPDGIFPTALS